MKTKITFILPIFLCSFISAQQIRYIAHDASGANNGTSWADAYTDIRVAIEDSPINTEYWIKAGTYIPTEPGSTNSTRNSFITMSTGKYYGGFAGNETARNQRNPKANVTIISGDRLQNDNGTTISLADNTLKILRINGPITLDGFTISGGNSNGTSSGSADRGSAIFSNFNINGEVKINNCIFENNNSSLLGPITIDTPPNNNNTVKRFTFTRCIFRKNTALAGGVFFVRQQGSISPEINISNSLFENNTANVGSVAGGSVMWLNRNSTDGAGTNDLTVNLINNTFVKNEDKNGGTSSLIVAGNNTAANASILVYATNCIFDGNVGASTNNFVIDPQNFSFNPFIAVENSQHDDNFPQVRNFGSVNNSIDANPAFVDFTNGDYRLSSTSPAINSGKNGVDYGTEDLLGNTRSVENIVDMGAYEFQAVLSITDNFLQNISFYPNPTKEKIHISNTNETIRNILIYNSLGQQVLKEKKFPVSINNLKVGTYFVKIHFTDNKKVVKRVIKK